MLEAHLAVGAFPTLSKIAAYIQEMLWEPVLMKEWGKTKSLPFYIREQFQNICEAYIGGISAVMCVFEDDGDLPPLSSLVHHIDRIQQMSSYPVVIVSNAIDKNRRQYLLHNHIPFVIPEKQIYMPFLGIHLQEKYSKAVPELKKLSPTAQVVFFYYLYHKEQELFMSEAETALHFSRMTLSRAFRQLEVSKCFSASKDGVRKKISGLYQGQELFQNMLPYLINPIQKVVYIDCENILAEALKSSVPALSYYADISSNEIDSFAIYNKTFSSYKNLPSMEYLLDANRQCRLEVWKYDPRLLSNNGNVDVLSLFMALQDISGSDERVEFAIGEAVKTVLEVKA